MVEVLHPGLYSSIQDLGRFGHQHYGVPVSGVMDQYSAKFANLLLGNLANDALIEATITGPKLLFHTSTLIVLTGADMSPKINGNLVTNNSILELKPFDVLSFGQLRQGVRTYIAIKGGFKTEEVLNSRSMYANITKHFVLKKGDKIPVLECDSKLQKSSKVKVSKHNLDESYIEVFKGPEFDYLTKEAQEYLSTKEFTIANTSNRMAYQVNELIKNNLDSILTSVVLPGTVQLTPSGQLIILAKDCQTTGGYPRILQLTQQSMCCLFQKNFGETIRFKIVNNSCKK